MIKVERPEVGDFARDYDETVRGMASHFVWLNRSKESVALDLKSDHGRAAVRALVEQADVFVQNLAPGAAARLGLDAATLRELKPGLVHVSISGYGPDGPYTSKKAYDLLVQCEAGLLSITGTPEEPSKVGISIADIASGMYAYSGILAALIARGRTGAGAPSRCPCWRPWPSGWASRSTTPSTGHPATPDRSPARGHRALRPLPLR